MEESKKVNTEMDIFKFICIYMGIVIAAFLFLLTPVYGAEKNNEADVYERFLNQRHTLKCRGVKTSFKADSFYVEDIDDDGVLELFVTDQDICKNNKYLPNHIHVLLYKYKANEIKLMAGVVADRAKTQYIYVSTAVNPGFYVNTYNKEWAQMNLDGTYKEYTSKPSLVLCKKRKLYKNTFQNRKNYLRKSKENLDFISQSQKEIVGYKFNMEKLAVSFADIFAKKAKNVKGTTAPNAKEQLKKLGNQLIITGYQENIPDEVIEAFATAVLNTIKESNIDTYETNQNKLVKQIYNQVKSGLQSDSNQIILNKITYTVDYTIIAQSFGGIGAQVSWANVSWRDKKNKSYSVHIVSNSTDENMKKALASYCAALAQLNKGVWKEFMVKYITDGWNLAELNSIKKLDDKTVSRFLDRSENLILVICGDKNAKEALLKDAGETLKEKISKMSKKQFRNFIKNHLPDGNQMIEIADQYKKVADKYNECKSKIDKWKNTKKGDDLTKFQIAYEELQDQLKALDVSLNQIA